MFTHTYIHTCTHEHTLARTCAHTLTRAHNLSRYEAVYSDEEVEEVEGSDEEMEPSGSNSGVSAYGGAQPMSVSCACGWGMQWCPRSQAATQG